MAKENNSRILSKVQGAFLDDRDFLREIIENFCQRLIRGEKWLITFRRNPIRGQKKRCGYRNGYNSRKLKTRVGILELLVPQNKRRRKSNHQGRCEGCSGKSLIKLLP